MEALKNIPTLVGVQKWYIPKREIETKSINWESLSVLKIVIIFMVSYCKYVFLVCLVNKLVTWLCFYSATLVMLCDILSMRIPCLLFRFYTTSVMTMEMVGTNDFLALETNHSVTTDQGYSNLLAREVSKYHLSVVPRTWQCTWNLHNLVRWLSCAESYHRW